MTPLTRDDTEHGKDYVLLSEAIAEFERVRAMIADDAWACTFQTLGQYRSALLRECGPNVRGIAGPTVLRWTSPLHEGLASTVLARKTGV